MAADSLAEARFRALVQNSSDIITVLGADGLVKYSSPASTRLLGYPEGHMRGQSAFDLVHPGDVGAVVERFAATMLADGPGEPVEFRMRHADGSWRYVEAVGNNLLRDPAVQGVVVNTRDVSDRKQAEAALRESEERYRRLVEHSPDAIAVHQDGRLVYVNPAGARLMGVASPDDLTGKSLFALVPPELHHQLSDRLGELAGHPEVHVRDRRFTRPDGEVLEVEVVAIPIAYEGSPATQLVVRDVTERKRFQDQLAHQALHDPLTGLPNRTLFLDRLDQALARSERGDGRPAVLFTDIDRFKLVNDSLGHDIGDGLLVAVAERLTSWLRPSDTIARFGGDEFVVLCEDTLHGRELAMLGERLLAALTPPFVVGSHRFHVSASVGIAVATDASRSAEALIRDADAAMYRAKDRGRGRYEIFDEDTRRQAQRRLHTENALRLALDESELRVYYQPIVTVADRHVVGVEALVRWQHPQHGLILPGHFIPVAEDSGLVVRIGEWVLEEACRQARSWKEALALERPLEMSVNLSARQLLEPDLVGTVARIMASGSFDPASVSLCLEVTESALMSDPTAAARALKELKALGFRIGIDDFGTGYSSLAYLKRFPFDIIKIDRSFVAGLGERPDDTAIVRAVVQLGHALGLTSVAEGVEQEQQWRHLQDLGCEQAQGFWFARPQPPEALEHVLASGSALAVSR